MRAIENILVFSSIHPVPSDVLQNKHFRGTDLPYSHIPDCSVFPLMSGMSEPLNHYLLRADSTA